MANNKKQVKLADNNRRNDSFEEYINQLESPNYQGGSWVLSDSPTPLEKSKHEICQAILVYQQKHKLTDGDVAQQMELTLPETEDILYYRINYFTLDRLLVYANKLFKSEPIKIKVVKDRNSK